MKCVEEGTRCIHMLFRTNWIAYCWIVMSTGTSLTLDDWDEMASKTGWRKKVDRQKDLTEHEQRERKGGRERLNAHILPLEHSWLLCPFPWVMQHNRLLPGRHFIGWHMVPEPLQPIVSTFKQDVEKLTQRLPIFNIISLVLGKCFDDKRSKAGLVFGWRLD